MKLFAFDLDGTSLRKHAYLSERNKQALYALHERNVILVPATGRISSFIPECITGLPGIRYMITSNGASVYDREKKKAIYQDLIPVETALEVQELLGKLDVYVEFYHEGIVKLERKYQNYDWESEGLPQERRTLFKKDYEIIESYADDLRAGKMKPEKINLPYIHPKRYKTVYEALLSIDGIYMTSSIQGNIEINSATCNKGNALAFLARHLGIATEDIMSIGDNGNDLEMLAFAGISVAMGNATEQVKKVAQYETDICEEDGLAKAVEKFLK